MGHSSPGYQRRWRESHPGYNAVKKREARAENPQKMRRYSRNWAAQNQEKVKNHRLKTLYGITLTDWLDIHSRQDGKCAICKKSTKQLMVDHNHETGKVRGLLCFQCNNGLGYVEIVGWLRNALQYLGEE